ncbi:protein MENT [Artibeus jamaicensis]|uniref:protein MENT n=1 Tax=Artibeus jamaicensis TaxID=9417 RepID=UPI00235A7EFF|nr:protein MENT [Artibeus jamaicensis]XP_036981922.2 protein MENT [Artibeus jamaicensis]
MVPAAGVLLWALLLSLEPPAAAGAQGLTSPGTQPVSFRLGGGTMTRKYRTTPRTGVPPKRKVIMEDDEDDIVANADRLAGPAAAELLASTVSTDISRLRSWEQGGDGSLEEGVMINAQKNNSNLEVAGAISSTTTKFTSRFAANIQEPEYRLTTSLTPSTWRSENPEHPPLSDTSLTRWSTAGSTPRPRTSTAAMPPPEDLRLVLMPWGPWHCHCKSGTMSRTRAGRLQGLSGRLRVGALSQLRTEHRPCTYHQCRCDRHLEECPLDSGPCSDASCSSGTTTTTTTTTSTTTTTLEPLSTRLRPSPLHLISPSPALAFWRQVRTGLEDIWNSLSSVFTKMQPIDRNRR